MTKRAGNSFMGSEIVDLYQYRPPYPDRLFDLLHRVVPATGRVLDLGAGPGKTARVLAQHFSHVTAVDPSPAMIARGKALPGGDSPRLTWVEGLAEDAPLNGRYDLVVAALSIHWMDHLCLFTRLADHLTPGHVLAVIEGDAPHDPPWQADWQAFMTKWVPLMTGQRFDPAKRPAFWDRYQQFVTVTDRHDLISEPIRQSIDDFILCQHSRDTFAISKLGGQRADSDRELAALLAPYADDAGVLQFRSFTSLTTAKIPL